MYNKDSEYYLRNYFLKKIYKNKWMNTLPHIKQVQSTVNLSAIWEKS